ncbi:hypothetical protein [Salinigranum sp.]|uniref:hypothetical protein n=1 Tax=Salinigranum sp. TaxID=1966351 RepID=UPI00356B2DAE
MPSRSSLDLLLALVGWVLLLFVPVSVVADAASVSVAGVSDLLLVALLAAPVATWFWWTGRPVGPLGAWFFWSVALTLALGLPVTITLGVLDAAPTTGRYPARVLGVGFTAVVYAGGYVLGYLDWASRFRDLLPAVGAEGPWSERVPSEKKTAKAPSDDD